MENTNTRLCFEVRAPSSTYPPSPREGFLLSPQRKQLLHKRWHKSKAQS